MINGMPNVPWEGPCDEQLKALLGPCCCEQAPPELRAKITRSLRLRTVKRGADGSVRITETEITRYE